MAKLSRFDLFVLSILIFLIIAVLIIAIIGLREDDSDQQVAYLVPGGANITNVWIADPDTPHDARQVTFARIGVDSFTVSPDGDSIVYAERDFESGSTEIRRVNLRTGNVDALTNCIEEGSICTEPVYSPAGDKIAYQRRTIARTENVGSQPFRVWIIDMTTPAHETYPLINEPDILGVNPTWSGDGTKLAFYNHNNAGIMVHDFTAAANDETSTTFIPTGMDATPSLSPTGDRIVFAEFLVDETIVRAYLQIADLQTLQFQLLTRPEEDAYDTASAWRPDASALAISRRYLSGERATPGQQIFLLDLRNGTLNPLVFDAEYEHGIFSWSPDGRYLVLQRYLTATRNNPQPEVWLYDMNTRRLTQLTANAYSPRWIP